MHKIDTSTAVVSMPTPSAAGTPGFFAHGDGITVPYTVLSSDWANAVQMEIANVITGAGIALSKTSQTQLLAALGVIGRIKLSATLNLYVSTTGNDSNNGLTSGTPFLTLQRAINIAYCNYDTQGNNIVVNVAAGTYTTGAVMTVPLLGGGTLQFLGNTSSPSTVVVTIGTTAPCFGSASGARLQVSGFSLSAPVGSVSVGGTALTASLAGILTYDHIIFNGCARSHTETGAAGWMSAVGPYTIAAGAPFHQIAGSGNSVNLIDGQTVTLTGTPAFSGAFCWADSSALIFDPATVFSGAATGSRYLAGNGGVIITAGGGASYFPGSTAGSSVGGYYS